VAAVMDSPCQTLSGRFRAEGPGMRDDWPGWTGQRAAYDADEMGISAFARHGATGAACSVALGKEASWTG
jgi:hypothetical protein